MPRKAMEIRSFARTFTESAIKTLVGIMSQPKATPAARVAAAMALLDRGWGKPTQALEHSGKDGKPLVQPVINVTIEAEDGAK